MADTADLDELARRYLELWQDQMSALADDPEFAEIVGRLTGGSASADAGTAAAWGAWPTVMAGLAPAGGKAGDGKGREKKGGAGGDQSLSGAPPTGAAPAAAASEHGGPDLDELLGRLAALEKRVAALESRPKGDGGSARRKPRKGRS